MGGRSTALLFFNLGAIKGRWLTSRSSSFTPGKGTKYPLYRLMDWPQSRSGWMRKISYPPWFDPRTVQRVASRYTNYAIPTQSKQKWDMLKVIHKENPTRNNSVSKFYFIFIWSSTCFGRNTAHHQEPKTALAVSGFEYVEDCWTCICWTLTASSKYTSNNPPRMQNLRLLVQF